MKFPNSVAAFDNFVITDVFAFSQVFVWIGDGANEVEKSDSVTVAMVTLITQFIFASSLIFHSSVAFARCFSI